MIVCAQCDTNDCSETGMRDTLKGGYAGTKHHRDKSVFTRSF